LSLGLFTGIVSVNVVMWHKEGRDCLWGCFRMCNWKKRHFFNSLPISSRQYDDL